MILTNDLYQFLKAAPAIAAIVGTRIYPVQLPQGATYPSLTYNQVDAFRVYSLAGPAGKVRRRISVDSWALTQTGVWNLAEVVRATLDGFAGTMGSIEVGSTFLEVEIPFFEEEAGTVGIHRVMQDYQIGHKES